MQYKEEMPFLTSIIITGKSSTKSMLGFTASDTFGSICDVTIFEIFRNVSSILDAPQTVPSSLTPM